MNRSQHIKHLYWRAGFGLSAEDWKARQHWTVDQAVGHLFDQAKNVKYLAVDKPDRAVRPAMMSADEKKAFLKEQRQKSIGHIADWMQRMSDGQGAPLVERMSLFWHGHFACDPKLGVLGVQQLNVLRQHGLGYFKDLVLGIAKDPAMIRYLNNQQNRKDAPNENFARELLELFTIGRGQYTETDIKEAARAFTGWSSNMRGEFVFRRFQHDYGSKTFMGKSGAFDGKDIIDIILEQQATAEFITRKIYRYFVNDRVDESRVQSLAKRFYQSDYHIGDLMKYIFKSDWFYDAQNIGTKIKSPTDLLVGYMTQLNLTFPYPNDIVKIQRGLGQVLFKPPNVAGWAGGTAWIDNATLVLRMGIPAAIYTASDISINLKAELDKSERKQLKKLRVKTDIQPLGSMVKALDKTEAIETLTDYLMVQTPRMDSSEITQYVDRRSPEALLSTLCLRLMSLPEYQMC